MLCAGFHLVAYIINCLHPPYPVLVVSFILAGFGNGLAEGAWNAWVGSLARASELLGFMHALYGIGGVMSPLLATSLITKAHLPWYAYYYVMVRYPILVRPFVTVPFRRRLIRSWYTRSALLPSSSSP